MDEHIEAVQRMQDYITAHLDTDISMADLARVSRYSPWYSYSPFVDLLHMTPAVYSRRLRLSKQIVIPERQTRRQPCCKFLSLSHIFQHPPVYANRRMFFSFSSRKA